MAGKTIGSPESFTSQFFDGEAVSLASTDWTPTKATQSFATAVMCTGTGGAIFVDFAGIDHVAGSTNVNLTIATNQILQVAITKIHKTGTVATGLVALY